MHICKCADVQNPNRRCTKYWIAIGGY